MANARQQRRDLIDCYTQLVILIMSSTSCINLFLMLMRLFNFLRTIAAKTAEMMHLHINHWPDGLKKPAGYNADSPITAKHRLRFLSKAKNSSHTTAILSVDSRRRKKKGFENRERITLMRNNFLLRVFSPFYLDTMRFESR